MSTQSSYKMNDKLGVIAILIAATGMAMVGTFSRGATKGLLPEDKAVIGSFLSCGRMTTAMFGFMIIAIIQGKFRDLWKAFLLGHHGWREYWPVSWLLHFVDADDVDCKRSLLDLYRSSVLHDLGSNLPKGTHQPSRRNIPGNGLHRHALDDWRHRLD